VNWQALLHNKWALAGLGVAGAAGVFVFLRRRAAGATSSAPATGAQTSPGYAGGVGTFDSTGTDVANWLGHYSDNLDQQFRDFLAQAARSGGAASIPTGTSGTGSPSPATTVYVHAGPARLLRPWGQTPVWTAASAAP
jgi:hypothetical protein